MPIQVVVSGYLHFQSEVIQQHTTTLNASRTHLLPILSPTAVLKCQ